MECRFLDADSWPLASFAHGGAKSQRSNERMPSRGELHPGGR
jgi:hypothetical protein